MGKPKPYLIVQYRAEVQLGPGDAYMGVKLIAEGTVGDDTYAYAQYDQETPFGIVPQWFVKDADYAFYRASLVH